MIHVPRRHSFSLFPFIFFSVLLGLARDKSTPNSVGFVAVSGRSGCRSLRLRAAHSMQRRRPFSWGKSHLFVYVRHHSNLNVGCCSLVPSRDGRGGVI